MDNAITITNKLEELNRILEMDISDEMRDFIEMQIMWINYWGSFY